MRNIKRRISDLRGRDISWLFQIITLTITLVAFFTAVDYFTSQSSLEIRLMPDSSKIDVLYYSDTIRTFYKKNSLDIPKALNSFFAVEKRTIPEDYIEISDSTPGIDVITARGCP